MNKEKNTANATITRLSDENARLKNELRNVKRKLRHANETSLLTTELPLKRT